MEIHHRSISKLAKCQVCNKKPQNTETDSYVATLGLSGGPKAVDVCAVQVSQLTSKAQTQVKTLMVPRFPNKARGMGTGKACVHPVPYTV
jgi:hypothetical protein